jgi:hypothetical protein
MSKMPTNARAADKRRLMAATLLLLVIVVSGWSGIANLQSQASAAAIIAAQSTATPRPVTATAGPPAATPSRAAQPTQAAARSANPTATPKPKQVVVNGRTYNAYIPAASKKGQWYHYTCEFDAAWVVFKTYGFDVGLEKMLELMTVDKSIEPYYKETKQGTVIYGGNITTSWSGDYKKNFLARSTGSAMRKVFEHYGLKVTPVSDRAGIEAALLRGELVWIKTTVDFKPWKPATWIMPDGRTHKTVLGNDHAAVVMGYSERGVVMRDVLGPTSTGRNRKYEYEVPWPTFMASWGAQSYDGLAVAPPAKK